MAPTTFIQTLKAEVARMQAAHPEREGELVRACALIANGLVTPSLDDPGIGRVLSSDLTTTYTVNGSCDCQAGAHGKPCKHRDSWRLYQYIERKLAAQEPPQTQGEEVDTSISTIAPTALPEAPASANMRVTICGREVQVTLRDSDEARLLVRVEELLQRYPVAQAYSQPQERGKDFCAIHNVPMKENHKDGRTWYSHKTTDGSWCKGRKGARRG